MSSRQNILQAIRQNKPEAPPLPASFAFDRRYEDPIAKFAEVLQGIGGMLIKVPDLAAVAAAIQQLYPESTTVTNGIPGLHLGNWEPGADTTSSQLERIYLTVLRGELAVAENSAIWLSSQNLTHRVLPFICQHLVLVITADLVVSTMHQAYEKLSVEAADYGVFIAGPSKTADIEQSLVIGAHGPRSLTVFLLPA